MIISVKLTTMLLTRTSLAPLLSMLLLEVSCGFLTTFLSLRLAAAGYPDPTIGVVQGAHYVGILLGALIAQKIIQMVGHLRANVLAACLVAVSVLVMSLWIHPLNWGILRALQGLGIGTIFVVVESWLLARHDNQQRGRILGLYAIAMYAGQSLSQPILSVLDWMTVQPFIVSATLCAISLVPILVIRSGATELEIKPHAPLRFLRAAPFGTLAGLVEGIVLGALYAFCPIWADEVGLSPPWTMATLIAGAVVAQWPLGRLADFVDRKWLLWAIALFTVILGTILWLVPAPGWIRLVLIFLLGTSSFSLYPIGLIHLADHVTAVHLAGAAALLNLVYGVGAIIGPSLAPAFLTPFGNATLFPYISAWCLLLLLFGLIPFKLTPIITHNYTQYKVPDEWDKKPRP
jgi:MFS family permease